MHSEPNDSKHKKKEHPVFNNEYDIISSLGEGNTSKVYLIRSQQDPSKKYALKLIRDEFLKRDESSLLSVQQEIQILKSLQHPHIINCIAYGSDGVVQKPSGRVIDNLVYIMLEFVAGGLLFDLCQTLGGMGEDAGRYFLKQMLCTLDYIQNKGIVHRDLKLENILVDDQMNLKVADFGFATYKKIDRLRSYRGTMTYMAPEIKEGRVYNGKQIDIFSTGVILFIIVNGIFPFKEAKRDEYFYKMLLKGQYDLYWKKVGGTHLSQEFKSLMQRFFSVDGKDRPTLEDLKNDPWFKKPFSYKMTKQNIMERLQTVRSEKTADSSREGASSRGVDALLKIVRQASLVDCYRFNDMTDFDIDVQPGDVWEELNSFNCDMFDSKLTLDLNIEKRHIKLKLAEPTTIEPSEVSKFCKEEPLEIQPLEVKVKFYYVNEPTEEGEEGEQQERDEGEDEELASRYRVKFTLKQGCQADWYELFAKMKETSFDDLLLPTREHHNPVSLIAEDEPEAEEEHKDGSA